MPISNKLEKQQSYRINKAIADTNFYVDYVNGNDGNTGLTTSTAFKTLSVALAKVAQTWDFQELYLPKFTVVSTTLVETSTIFLPQFVGIRGNAIEVTGEIGITPDVTWGDFFLFKSSNNVVFYLFNNFKFTSNGSNSVVFSINWGQVYVQNCIFTGVARSCLEANLPYGYVELGINNVIENLTATQFALKDFQAYLIFRGLLTAKGNSTFSAAFVVLNNDGITAVFNSASSVLEPGATVTGKKFILRRGTNLIVIPATRGNFFFGNQFGELQGADNEYISTNYAQLYTNWSRTGTVTINTTTNTLTITGIEYVVYNNIASSPVWTIVQLDSLTVSFPTELTTASEAYLYFDSTGTAKFDVLYPSEARLNGRVYRSRVTTNNNSTFTTVSNFVLDASPNTIATLSGNRRTQRFSGLVPQIKAGDATKWQVGIGAGQIIDSYTNARSPITRTIENTALQEYPIPSSLNGTTVTFVYAYYYWTGTAIALAYQTTAPVADDLVDKLFLCAIISTNGTTITELRPISLSDDNETKTLLDRGAVNIDYVFLAPVASTMRLSFPGGRFKFAGRNAYNNPKLPHTLTYSSVSQISYSLCSPTGTVLATENTFNFNRYWNGTAIATLPVSSYATVQFVYLFPSGAFAVVLSPNYYMTLDLAIRQWEVWEKTFPVSFRNNSILLTVAIGTGSATNISDTNQAVIINYGVN